MGPGGGARAKEETRGRCDSVKIEDELVCKTLWGPSGSLSKKGERGCPLGAGGVRHQQQGILPVKGTPLVRAGSKDQGKLSDRRVEGRNERCFVG